MGWSTRELAELAGTSLRSVRHYHDVGLLPEPERRSNGYKQYGVAHLVRLLRIKRLSDLGFSLPQIAELGEGDEHPAEALRALDDDLAGQIRRLEQLRAELAEILERSVPTDLPPDLAVASEVTLTETDRQFVAVMGRTLGEDGRETYAALLGDDDADMALSMEFHDLAEDADDDVRDALAVRMADQVLVLARKDPRIVRLGEDSPGGVPRYVRTMNRAMEDLYNPAQLDVIRRMRRAFQARWTGG
ncbi:MerR family transcriptional regulator [Actinomycetospora endophytica]|uniref:MerR family transcriptional regulator n=1 Tax=Actinomycetospora endophytica TaxID=2291215 RepID=A0ABS8PIP0_9PSEU|nr:MerR family transcriptional regulator [Actinomycetospora endophytica]MCD2198153.1 MerR family transcriptional regulator [Actinomycetospora endophytica]